MNNTLPAIIQDSKVVLAKSKNLIGITNKILATRSSVLAEVLVKKPYARIGHIGGIKDFSLSPDGKTLLSIGNYGQLQLWDVENSVVIHTFDIDHSYISPDSTTILFYKDNAYKLLDVKAKVVTRFFNIKKLDTAVFSPDGTTILFYENHMYILMDVKSGELHRGNFEHSAFDSYDQISVVFSPDGAKILFYEDHMYILLDVKSGELHQGNFEHSAFDSYDQISVVFSPDGTKILFYNTNSYVLFDIKMNELHRGNFNHTYDQISVVFSPDGTKILFYKNGMCILMDIKSGELLRGNSITFSNDGFKMISGSDVYDTKTQKYKSFLNNSIIWLSNYSRTKFSLLSPDGNIVYLIIYFENDYSKNTPEWEEAFIYDFRTNIFKNVGIIDYYPKFSSDSNVLFLRNAFFNVHTAELIDTIDRQDQYSLINFGPDNTKVLTNNYSQKFEIDIESPLQIINKDYFANVLLSSDRKTLLLENYDDTLKLCDMNSNVVIQTFIGHINITSVAFSPDGRKVLSGSKDNTLHLWNVHNGELIQTFEGHTKPIVPTLFGKRFNNNSFAFSPDGRTLLSGSDNTLKLWDTHTGECLRTFEGHTASDVSVVLSPDGKTVLSNSSNDMLSKLWDVHSGELIVTLRHLWNFAFSPDGKMFLFGSDNTLKLWDTHSGNYVRTFEGHAGFVHSVAFSPDGRMFLSGSNPSRFLSGRDKNLILWNVHSGEQIRTFTGHTGTVRSITFSPDGRMFLSGSDDKTLILWDVHSGEQIRTFTGHTNTVRSITFSPDGRMFLSGSDDKTLILWDVHSGNCVRTFERHTDSVYSVAFSPDGKMLLSVGSDKTLKLWDVYSGKELGSMIAFTDGEWVAITPDGYFNHSPNGRQYLLVNPTDMSAETIDDASYNHYYRPNGLLREHDTSFNLPEIEINEDEISF